MNTAREPLPVAIIGAGPVGLAAAAHLVARGLTPLIFERGPAAGHAVAAWGHVRLFSPWAYNIDRAARTLLEQQGWQAPAGQALPSGAEIVRDYLRPLAAHPAIAPHLLLRAEVLAVTRRGLAKVVTAGREAQPFVLVWRDAEGRERRSEARAVIDASGTWFQPNPIGVDGLPVEGEAAAGDRIAYGLPDVAGKLRADYAGRRVLVVGGGHSAINLVLDLLALQERAPDTRIFWGLRRKRLEKLLGGGPNDQLPARGALGLAARRALDSGRLTLLAPLAVQRLAEEDGALRVEALRAGAPYGLTVDRLVVATGFRPDLALLRELRIELDPWLEAPPALAPLIDPNLHSCGDVPPHGAEQLCHPETNFYIAGAKSYGRAPTVLMATGYEQVRSIVAELAGDRAAARQVQLVLPKTGVCGVLGGDDLTEALAAPVACCGRPA